MLCLTAASAKEIAPDQTTSPEGVRVVGQPPGRPKSVTTTIIKRCPEGYELVVRANGQRACAKDIVPANE